MLAAPSLMVRLVGLVAVGVCLTGARPAAAQVLTAQYGNARLNATTAETTLTPRRVTGTGFGRVAALSVDGDVYAQPLYVPHVTLGGAAATGGAHDLLLVATEAGSLYAFDARSVATRPLWRRSFVNPAAGVVPLAAQDVRCPFIRPQLTITPTPVVDAATATAYVLVRTKESTAGQGPRFVQRLHAVDLRTGSDARTPVEIRASVAGKGAGARDGRVDFDPLRENPRAALLLDRGVVYAAWGSSCDVGPYHGWVMAYDAASLRQLATFNSSPDGDDAGIWQGDAGLAADAAGRVYAVTGNGTFDHAATVRDYGNTVLQLRLAGGALQVTDYFTPSNEAALTREDADLGSSGPMLLPADAASGAPLIFVTGKEGASYLVDAGAMGRFREGDNPHARQVVRTSTGGFGAAAYWNHTLYVWGSDDVLRAYPLRNGRLDAAAAVRASTRTSDPGTIPVVSANGGRDGIVWAIETRTWRGADRAAVLRAYDAADVRRELYDSEANASRDRAGLATRFAIPTVAAGRVFVGAKGEVDVYGLLRP